jgi:ADP-heptose:LPS heptosyltransferase
MTDAASPPANPGDTLKRVLVIKLGALGDFIQSLGAMRVVRATHPSARITLLTTEPFAAFARACPYFDIVEADGRPRDLKGRSELVRRLRSTGYDMVYDFQNNDRTAQYYSALGARRPLWSGAAPGASHQHRNPERAMMHNFDRLEEQLRHAGLKPRGPGDRSGWREDRPLVPNLSWIRPAFRDPPRFQPAYFSITAPFALLIPGSSADHPEKRWPAERFAEMARRLADRGVTPVVVGAKAEGDLGANIQRMEPRTKNLVGRTDLFQLAALAERACVSVGGDTGPMHLASAAGSPGVCLFAQDWTPAMAAEMRSVWSPRTRLGRAAPKGEKPVIIVYASSLERISADDAWRSVETLIGRSLPPAHAAPR